GPSAVAYGRHAGGVSAQSAPGARQPPQAAPPPKARWHKRAGALAGCECELGGIGVHVAMQVAGRAPRSKRQEITTGTVVSEIAEMSRQARKRRRAHNRAGPTRILLIGSCVFVGAAIIGTIAAVAYVLNVADSAPKISALHPILGVGSSHVYEADATPHSVVPADLLRSPADWQQQHANLQYA